MANIIIDAVLSALILFFIIFFTSKGLVNGILKIGKIVAAIFLTNLFGKFTANLCSKYFIRSFSERIVATNLEKIASDDTVVNIEEILDGLPAIFKNLIDVEALKEKAITTIEDFKINATTMVDNTLSTVVGYVITFVVLFIVLSLIAFIISKLFDIPGLRTINRILGFLFGIATAYVAVSFAVMILGLYVDSSILDATYVCKFITKIGLFTK